MRLTLPTHDQSVRQELPDELYIGFVDNLLVEVRSLFLACTASVAAALVAAIASRSVSLWACAGLMLLLSFVRMHFQLVHAKNRPSPNIEAARKREWIFVAGATAQMALLSTWTLVAFLVTDEGFVRFLAFNVTVPYAFGMWTRSFALDRGMNAQIVAAFVPAERGASYWGRLVSVDDRYFSAAVFSVHQIVLETPQGHFPGGDCGA